MNPFDDIELEQRVVRNPFTFNDHSPIAAAVNSEALRQASALFKSAFEDVSISRTTSGLDPTFPFAITPRAASTAPTADMIATVVFGDIWDDETIPTVQIQPAQSDDRPASAGLSRSRTDAKLRPNTEQHSRQIFRAASARAVVSRRASSRCVNRAEEGVKSASLAQPLAPSSRPASARAISSRAGAIAAGDEDVINLVRSRSRQNVALPLAPGAAALLSPIGSPRPEAERTDTIVELILQKFWKHIRCEKCADDHLCMCSRECEETATVFSQRYGRLGNIMRVRPGYYCINHLVEIFIDAYDEEKRMSDIEKGKYRRA